MSSVNLGKRAVRLPKEYKRGGERHGHDTLNIVSGTSFGTGVGTHFADQNKSSKGSRGMTRPQSAQRFGSFVMPRWALCQEPNALVPWEAFGGVLEENRSNRLSKHAQSRRWGLSLVPAFLYSPCPGGRRTHAVSPFSSQSS